MGHRWVESWHKASISWLHPEKNSKATHALPMTADCVDTDYQEHVSAESCQPRSNPDIAVKGTSQPPSPAPGAFHLKP